MILVFGGTTEGRKAVEVLDESGTPYYYSTRGKQDISPVHATHISGGMDLDGIVTFCRDNDIRLIVDAAHPFAEQLHANIVGAAHDLGLPVIRYDRIYPPRTPDVIWCRDYASAISQMQQHGIDKLLALTGVNTVGKLRPYWQHRECWCRILDRQQSLMLATKSGFPEDHLVFYEEESTADLIGRLRPDAILTKESGVSGGFEEKVTAALAAGIKVFAVQRPDYPPSGMQSDITVVNGPYGLRRTVERLLPDFFPLKSGLTTGTCATAAAIAATQRLLTGQCPDNVPVTLPDGETIDVAVEYGDGFAFVVKQAGDDPDVTNGIEIRATAERSDTFTIKGGEGVGRFTLPGFDYPVGEAAINKSPRNMMRDNIHANVCITISVPDGEQIARRTFNPRLGIEGGISIIGVSGIVKPFSEEAFVESIHKCMQVACASGSQRVVINSGAKSEKYVKALYPDLPKQAFVEYGNYIGQTLGFAEELKIPHVTLGVMLGKAVKLAAGHLDTHSRRAVMDKGFIAGMLAEAGCDIDISTMTLARELWEKIPASGRSTFASVVLSHCYNHCKPLLPSGQLTILLIDDEGTVYQQQATR